MSSAALAATHRALGSVSSQEELGELGLEAAITEGDAVLVERLMGEHGHANFSMAFLRDMLFVCCEGGHAKIAALLLATGVEANVRLDNQDTPLHVACTHKHPSVIEVLLGAKADVDARTRWGVTPLLKAAEGCSAKDLETAKLLLAAHATVDMARDSGCTPLYAASAHGVVETARLLLSLGATVDAVTQSVATARANTVARARGCGRPTQPHGVNTGSTPLYASCINGHIDVTRLLLSAGASVNRVNQGGAQALHAVCLRANLALLRLLLCSKADANALKADGATPLSIAAQQGHAGVLACLLKAGARDPPIESEAEDETVAARESAKGASAAPPKPVSALLSAAARDTPQHRACLQILQRAQRVASNFQAAERAAEVMAEAKEEAVAVAKEEAVAVAKEAAAAAKEEGMRVMRERMGAEGCPPSPFMQAAIGRAATAAAGAAVEEVARLRALGALESLHGATAVAQRQLAQSAAARSLGLRRPAAEEIAEATAAADAAAAALIAEEEAESRAKAHPNPGRKGGKNKRGQKAKTAVAATIGAAVTAASSASSATSATLSSGPAGPAVAAAADAAPAASVASAEAGRTDEDAPPATEGSAAAGAARATPREAETAATTLRASVEPWLPPTTARSHAATSVSEPSNCSGSPARAEKDSGEGGGCAADGPPGDWADAFLCPITQDYMRDPVVTADGQTYEREAIQRWVEKQRARGLTCTSPITGEPLAHSVLVPNVALRGLIRDTLERRPELLTGGSLGSGGFASI